MTSTFCLLTTEDLQQLAAALRSGRVVPPINSLSLRRSIPASLADRVADELRQKIEEGIAAPSSGRSSRHPEPGPASAPRRRGLDRPGLDRPGGRRDRQPRYGRRGPRDVPERQGIRPRRRICRLPGALVFKALAERMEQHPQLDVQMFLDIQRPQHDQSSSSELVRRFAERFARHEWPGRRLPSLFYDPRSLEIEPARRASLHAKCVVVDQGAGLRLLGKLHGSGSNEEHRGRRSTSIALLRTATDGALRDPCFEASTITGSAEHLVKRWK